MYIFFLSALECPKLKSLPRGRTLTPYNNYILERVNFTCNPGYRLIGYMFAECESTGEWSNDINENMPKCVLENGKFSCQFLFFKMTKC